MSEALQNALAAIDAYPGDGSDRDQLIRAKCRGLMRGYDARWFGDEFTALSVEQVYKAELINPATLSKSRSFEVAGKLDVYAKRRSNRQRFIIDHKTASEDIEDPNAPYWQQLKVEGQVTHYMLLMWLIGERPDGAIWDVIRKPSISPKKLTKAERASAVAERKYYGVELDYETLMALQTEDRETLAMYEARLAHDCTTERPERYFQRRAVPRIDREVLEYAEDLWQHSQDILAARKVARLPKNSGACMQYGSPCTFLGICSGFDTPDSDRWKQKDVQHPELDQFGNIDALTNSRIRTFQTCRVRHRFQYEMRIERHDDEDSEALYFGSCLHAGLESWWRFFLVEEGDDASQENTAATAVSG